MTFNSGAEEQGLLVHKENVSTHNHNLRTFATKQGERISLAIADESTGVKDERQYMTVYPKVHAHVMLNQMNIRERQF